MQKESQERKLEIFLHGGVVFQVEDSFAEIMAMMDGQEIHPEDFIYLRDKDGCCTALRKKDVVAVAEYDEKQGI